MPLEQAWPTRGSRAACGSLPGFVRLLHSCWILCLCVFYSPCISRACGKKCTAKRKYEDEHRTFLKEWESFFFFLLNVMASHSALYLKHHWRISRLQIFSGTSVHSMLTSTRNFHFSVALDECCDIQDKPQLAIFTRSVSKDCVIKEELLDIVPLKDRTRGIDVKETMVAAFVKANLPISKLTAIATDGAPAMIGSVNGLVGLCKADRTFPEFWNFHWSLWWKLSTTFTHMR